jgi:hypothetical protein
MVSKPQKIDITHYLNLCLKETPRFKLLPEPQKLLANMGAIWVNWAAMDPNGLTWFVMVLGLRDKRQTVVCK